MTEVNINYRLTDSAARVFLAARGEGGRFSFAAHGAGEHFEPPSAGDEVEFPGITGGVIFTVVKRRFQMQEGHEVTLTLWLDAPEDAHSPMAATGAS